MHVGYRGLAPEFRCAQQARAGRSASRFQRNVTKSQVTNASADQTHFVATVPVQRDCPHRGGEAAVVQRGSDYSHGHASHQGTAEEHAPQPAADVAPVLTRITSLCLFQKFLLILGCAFSRCVTGRGAHAEEDQEENPQQAVGAGEPKEEEGVCGWAGKQVTSLN